MAEWVLSLGIRAAGKQSYVKVAKAIFQLLERPMTQIASRSLARLAAQDELEQAPAIMPWEIASPLLRDIFPQLLLAWKTASRWDEMTRLTPESMPLITTEEIIIDWDTETKGSQLNQFRASQFAVIRGDGTELLARWLWSLPTDQPVTTMDQSAVVRRLKQVSPRLSAHSIKAGALDHLLRSGASLELIPRLSKHMDDAHDPPPTLLRYFRDRIALARALGTGALTVLL